MNQLDPTPRRHSRSPHRPRAPRRERRLLVDQLEGRQLLASALVASSAPLAALPVEGKSFTGVVAKFTDADKNTDLTQYSAVINWGDGHTSTGTISADATAGFDVAGTHTYALKGVYRIAVKIDDKDGASATANTSNIVTDAALTATSVGITATKGMALKNVVVANFTDANPQGRLAGYVATIAWGDGTSSAGTVVAKPGGGFKVLGSHTYNKIGAFTVGVSIRDGGAGPVATQAYAMENLISDGKVAADHTNSTLVNPWGLVASTTSPFWDTNNGSGNSILFDGAGNQITAIPQVVVPPPTGAGGASAPTGIVFNNTAANPTAFLVSNGTASAPAVFIFATEDGTIAGWNPGISSNNTAPSTQSFFGVDNSASGAVYKGLAEMTIPAGSALATGPYLFATNFHSGQIDVFDQNFHAATLPAGAFHDPLIPAGYAPFGIQALNGNIYVTYALQDANKHDDVAGAGHGYVDVFNANGYLIQRLGGPGAQPELNSPWGMTMAPQGFGKFSGDILVGNFGDSHVNAFNPTTGAFLGQLVNAQNQPLVLDGGLAFSKGLWGLAFGNGGAAGPKTTLFFTSGINGEADGLFGSVTPVTISTTAAASTANVKAPAAAPASATGGSSSTGASSPGGSSGGGVSDWVVVSTAASPAEHASDVAEARRGHPIITHRPIRHPRPHPIRGHRPLPISMPTPQPQPQPTPEPPMSPMPPIY